MPYRAKDFGLEELFFYPTPVCLQLIVDSLSLSLSPSPSPPPLSTLRQELEKERYFQKQLLDKPQCSCCELTLGRLFNSGAPCPNCLYRVCKTCRVLSENPPPPFLCPVCAKKRLAESIFEKQNTYETRFPFARSAHFNSLKLSMVYGMLCDVMEQALNNRGSNRGKRERERERERG